MSTPPDVLAKADIVLRTSFGKPPFALLTSTFVRSLLIVRMRPRSCSGSLLVSRSMNPPNKMDG